MMKMDQIAREKHSPPGPLSRRAKEGKKKQFAPFSYLFTGGKAVKLLNLNATQTNKSNYQYFFLNSRVRKTVFDSLNFS